MNDTELRDVLCSILEMLKQQASYSRRLHGWLIAVAETIEKHPELAEHLKKHPTYDQGPDPNLQRIETTIQRIDALILRLRVQ